MILSRFEESREGKKYGDVGAGNRMTHIYSELKQGMSWVQLRFSLLQPCFSLMEYGEVLYRQNER